MNKATKNPEWGHKGRDKKANQIFGTLEPHLPAGWESGVWLDLGCGTGVIAASLSKRVDNVIGADAFMYGNWRDLECDFPNLRLISKSFDVIAQEMPNVFDVIISNQVYEHVEDPQGMVDAIYTLLKPGGVCYFAGPNLWFPIEPHVMLPFVHWLPRQPVCSVMKWLGFKKNLDAYSVNVFQLSRWFERFQVINALPDLKRYLLRSSSLSRIVNPKNQVFDRLIKVMTPVLPGFVYVLRKPGPISEFN